MKKRSLAVRVTGSLIDFLAFTALCGLLAHRGIGHSILPGGFLALATFILICFGATTIITESHIAWPFSQAIGKIPVLGPALYEATYTVTKSGPNNLPIEEEVPADTEGAVLKDEHGLLKCPLCTGMWVGAILAAVGVAAFEIGGGLEAGVKGLIVHGLIGSSSAYALHHIIKR